MSTLIDFKFIKEISQNHLEEVCRKLLPNGKRSGNEWVCGSINGEAGDSFKVNLVTGIWCDFNGGSPSGRDAISLVARFYNIKPKEAAQRLADMLGINISRHSKSLNTLNDGQANWAPKIPAPLSLPKTLPDFPKNTELGDIYHYRDSDGQLMFAMIRFNLNGVDGLPLLDENGKRKKTFSPLSCDGQKWAYKAVLKPWPLYNLDLISSRPNDPILIVEGEKAANAVRTVLPEFIPTCWPHGVGSWKNTDFEPLSGRNVVLWPDNDQVGQNAMLDAAKNILQKANTVHLVDLEKMGMKRPLGSILPLNWDVADAINEKWEAASLLEALNKALIVPSVTDKASKIILVCANDIKPEPIEWIWKDYLAKGKLHIIAGKPASGKTTIAIELAAIISRGGKFPDGSIAQFGNILIWSSEDSKPDVLIPRLIAAEANIERVHFVEGFQDGEKSRPFDPSIDMMELEKLAQQVGNISLLILDPIVTAIKGDSNSNSDTRKGLQPIVDFAERIGCAVLGISHFTKGTAGADPLERITGSLAFGAVTRMAFIAAKPDESDHENRKRIFTRAKSSLGPDGYGFYYDIQRHEFIEGENTIDTSKIVWLGQAKGSARELLSQVENYHSRSAMDYAKDFLKTYLKDGPLPSKEILELASQEGISKPTLDRAKKNLKAKSGKPDGLNWSWYFPVTDKDQDYQGYQDNQPPKSDNLDNLEFDTHPLEQKKG